MVWVFVIVVVYVVDVNVALLMGMSGFLVGKLGCGFFGEVGEKLFVGLIVLKSIDGFLCFFWA